MDFRDQAEQARLRAQRDATQKLASTTAETGLKAQLQQSMAHQLSAVGKAAAAYLVENHVAPEEVGYVKHRINTVPRKYVVTGREWCIFKESHLWLTTAGEWNVRPTDRLYKMAWVRTGVSQTRRRIGVGDRDVPGEAKPVRPASGALTRDGSWHLTLYVDDYDTHFNLWLGPDGELHYGSLRFEDAVADAVGRMLAS